MDTETVVYKYKYIHFSSLTLLHSEWPKLYDIHFSNLTLLHPEWPKLYDIHFSNFTLLHSEWPKLYGVLAILSAIGLNIRHHLCILWLTWFLFAFARDWTYQMENM